MNITNPESFLKLLSELRDYTLIVEGKKDERALKTLGLKDIIPINRRPMADFVDGLDEKSQFVILTDFDSEGKRMAAKLQKLLQRCRIKANPRLRHMIMAETEVSRMEELNAISGVALIKEKGDIYGEIGANFYKICYKGKHKGKRHC